MPPAGKTLGTVDGKTRLARRSKRRRPRFVRSGEIPEGEYFTMHASRARNVPRSRSYQALIRLSPRVSTDETRGER
jgi:hypothetical protein